MNPQTIVFRCSAASKAVAGLAPPVAKPAPAKMGMLGVGLKMHFVWAEAERRFREGSNEIRVLAATETVAQPAPGVAPDEASFPAQAQARHRAAPQRAKSLWRALDDFLRERSAQNSSTQRAQRHDLADGNGFNLETRIGRLFAYSELS